MRIRIYGPKWMRIRPDADLDLHHCLIQAYVFKYWFFFLHKKGNVQWIVRGKNAEYEFLYGGGGFCVKKNMCPFDYSDVFKKSWPRSGSTSLLNAGVCIQILFFYIKNVIFINKSWEEKCRIWILLWGRGIFCWQIYAPPTTDVFKKSWPSLLSDLLINLTNTSWTDITHVPRCAHTLHGHQGDVLDLSWSPGDRWLASCSIDNTIIIWDMQTASGWLLFTM